MRSRTGAPGLRRWSLAVLAALLLFLPILPFGSARAEVDSDTLGSAPGRFNSIVADDVDGDGRVELVTGNYEGYLNILEYRDGDFELEWRSPQWGHRLWGVEFLDVDGDGQRELVTGDGDGTVRILDGRTHAIELTIDELGRDAHGFAVGDMDLDGDTELFVGTGYKTDNGWGNVQVFDGATGRKEAELGPFDSRLRGMQVADLDDDGRDELVVGSGVSLGEVPGEGYLRVFSYDEAQGRYVLEWKSDDLDGCTIGVQVADLNGDGTLDIVASTGYRYREGYIYAFTYAGTDGGGQGVPPLYRKLWQSDDIGPKVYGLAVGDIDDDGHYEIVAGTNAGYMYIYEAPGWDLEWKSDLLGLDVLGIALADVDGDGSTEIVAAQGGYNGKADFTSGYTEPHIYIIDGRTHRIETVIGQTDYLKIGLQIASIVLIILFLLGLRIFFRGKRIARTLPVDDRRGVTR